MNQETNAGAQDAQQGRTAPSKRSSRSGRNRPVLVSPTSNDQETKDKAVEETSDTVQPVEEDTPTTKVEDARPRRLPRFFSSVGKNESEKDQTGEANPTTARISRAIRGVGGSSASSRAAKEIKPAESQQSANKATAKVAPKTAPQRPGGFKMRYIMGMLLYLILAEVIGGFERTFLISNHLDKLLFQLGPLAVTTSTVLFLLTLIILLVVLARFDLVPRSLAAMSSQPTTQRGKSSQSSGSGPDNAKGQQPTMKQGVKGADDDLYQEYREQQRYLQRRERKK